MARQAVPDKGWEGTLGGNPRDPHQNRFVLRPRTFTRVLWVLGSLPFLALAAAIGWASLVEGESINAGGLAVAAACGVIGLVPLALVMRCRLILTPDGFRLQRLGSGRLVPWTTVSSFEAVDDVGVPPWLVLGARWIPEQVEDVSLRAFWNYSSCEIPVFGRNQQQMVETLNDWLDRYGHQSSRR
jgi:hypothetical protein